MDRLWDRDGRLWQLAADEISRERTLELYFDFSVPVAVYEGASTLRWIEPSDRARCWREELESRTLDENWAPPRRARGALRFLPQEWHSYGDALLLFDDYD